MTEKLIQKALLNHFANYEYKLCNTFIFDWESDFFAISKSGYSVECEIKISRSDFKADIKKIDKHHIISNHKKEAVISYKYPFTAYSHIYGPIQLRLGDSSIIKFKEPVKHIPNKFYYVTPINLIARHEVPIYAGLIYINGNHCQVVKPAPFLHKVLNDYDKRLLSKYYYKNKNLINELIMLQFDIKSNFDFGEKKDYSHRIERLINELQ